MSTEFLRGALRIAILILALALVMLPFQPRASGEFVVTVMAAVVGGLFVIAVLVLLRWSAPALPPAVDARGRRALNGPPPTRGEGRDL